MTKPKILTPIQDLFLEEFGQSSISESFYLTGGTALSEFYIPYRYSEDLDFFSETDFNIQDAISFIRSIKDKIKYNNLDISDSFNRNLIFLEFENHSNLKTEFTYYPFPQIEEPKKINGVAIDSSIDIAVNKLFTIYQKPRSRDFMDLYMLIKKYEYKIPDLIKKARIKFDWKIDYLQLGTQFMESKNLKDYPNLLIDLKEESWQTYFLNEAKKLKDKIIEN